MASEYKARSSLHAPEHPTKMLLQPQKDAMYARIQLIGNIQSGVGQVKDMACSSEPPECLKQVCTWNSFHVIYQLLQNLHGVLNRCPIQGFAVE